MVKSRRLENALLAIRKFQISIKGRCNICKFDLATMENGRSVTTFHYCSVNHQSGLQTNTFSAIPSELLPFEIFFIMHVSGILPYPKGKKKGRQSPPNLRVPNIAVNLEDKVFQIVYKVGLTQCHLQKGNIQKHTNKQTNKRT